MDIIDAHVHLGLNSFCTNNEKCLPYDLENQYDIYIQEMTRAGISKAVVIPIPDLYYDIEKSNQYLVEAKDEYDNLYPICRIDNKLSQNINTQFCGAKLHKVYDKVKRSNLEAYLHLLDYYHKPLILHAEYKNKPLQIKKLLEIAPNLNIVLAHMGRGHIYTSEMVIDNANALKKYDNVYFETSTVGNASTIEDVANIIGSERIMFGSDYPFGKRILGDKYKYSDELNVVYQSKLTSRQQEDILCNTAKKLFCIENHNHVYISQYNKGQKESLMKIIENISEQDRKFLSIDKKIPIIKQDMRSEKHIFVIIDNNEVVGFFRESGRPNNTSILEEIFIVPNYRNKGIVDEIMKFYLALYPHCYAKSYSSNIAMNKIFAKYNFKQISGARIINWEHI